MQDYSKYFRYLRDNTTKKIRFFIHKKCDTTELSRMLNTMRYQFDDDKNYTDGNAHIISMSDHVCSYRINNDVYIIPATVKGIVNNNDGKLNFFFEYPCEMKRNDLVEY